MCDVDSERAPRPAVVIGATSLPTVGSRFTRPTPNPPHSLNRPSGVRRRRLRRSAGKPPPNPCGPGSRTCAKTSAPSSIVISARPFASRPSRASTGLGMTTPREFPICRMVTCTGRIVITLLFLGSGPVKLSQAEPRLQEGVALVHRGMHSLSRATIILRSCCSRRRNP